MNVKIVQQLADIMVEKDISSLEFCENETKIKMTRGACVSAQPVVQQFAPAQQPAAAAPAEQAEAAPAAIDGELIESPIVGIGYKSPAPGEQPFVSVGSRVAKGQVLCIIEAMKVMNEFAAPRDGEITEVCFEDGQLVEFGQPLFRMK